MAERTDSLERGGLRILQDPDKYCFSIDSVLLADFARAGAGQKVCDLCTGSGVVMLLMLARYPDALYTGVELQKDLVDMARRSIALNEVSGKVRVITGDIRQKSCLPEAASFDVVTANPPYMPVSGQSRLGKTLEKQLSRHEVACRLEDVCGAACYLLKNGGWFYLVHRPERLPEIFEELARVHLEPKLMQFVCPFEGKAPRQVLIGARKNVRRGFRVLPSLITYEKPGIYTRETLEVYGIHGESSRV